mgnify:CR=1 FL=1
MILTSVYGTCGAILIGVPVGFLTAVFLSKMAPKKLRTVIESAVSLLAGIPSVVYGLVGMLVLVPGIRKLFHVPDGASLLGGIDNKMPANGDLSQPLVHIKHFNVLGGTDVMTRVHKKA